MSDLPNCPLCGGNDLKLVASRPNANSSRVECACGVAGEWGKGEDGAKAGWGKLAARFASGKDLALQSLADLGQAFDAAPSVAPVSPQAPAAQGKRGKGKGEAL